MCIYTYAHTRTHLHVESAQAQKTHDMYHGVLHHVAAVCCSMHALTHLLTKGAQAQTDDVRAVYCG